MTWQDGVPTINVWALTAKNVSFLLYADSDPATEATISDDAGPGDGRLEHVTGEPGWTWQYYLFDVEVWVTPGGRAQRMVTDPYSISLAHEQHPVADRGLNDPDAGATGPRNKPAALPRLRDISLYETYMRDFKASTTPASPDDLKGTFMAFTQPNSYGDKISQRRFSWLEPRPSAAGLRHRHDQREQERMAVAQLR